MEELMNSVIAFVVSFVCAFGTASPAMIPAAIASVAAVDEESENPKITVKPSDRKKTLVCRKSADKDVLVYEVTSRKGIPLGNIPQKSNTVELPKTSTSSTKRYFDREKERIVVSKTSVTEKVYQKTVKGFRDMIQTTVTTTSTIKLYIPFVNDDEKPVSF